MERSRITHFTLGHRTGREERGKRRRAAKPSDNGKLKGVNGDLREEMRGKGGVSCDGEMG
jgi:hypothetical protein